MKKKIRVGIFVDGDFIPSYDGASNRFHYLSRYLTENGVEVVVFHGYRGWSDISLIKKEPFKTYIFPIKHYYDNLELIASLIIKESIDIIQFDNLEPILLQGVRLAELTGTKLVSEMHYVVRNLAKKLGADESRINEIQEIEEKVGKSIDRLISLSDQDKPFLEKYLGLKSDMISVIPSGVDCKELKYVGPNFDEKNIIFLGNLYFKPNEDAVRVMRNQIYPELRQYGFRFTIGGDCPPSLKKECAAPGFSFTGTIPDLNFLFKDATFALAPIDEGTGMRIKLLNYLAAGIPIITTGIATAGFSKKDYFLIEDDYSKYAAKIISLLKDKEALSQISKKGQSAIRKYYDWNIIAKQTIETYKKVLTTPKTKKLVSAYKLKNKEPVWLQEAVAKNRFKKIPSADLPDKYSFFIIDKGKIEVSLMDKIIALEGMPGAGKTTFITTLAYCYARSKISNNPKEYEKLLGLYGKIKNTITFPTHMIYLDVSIEESLKRRMAYSNIDMYKNWFNPTFLNHFRYFYRTELKKFIPIELSYIDTFNLTMKEVADKIDKILCKIRI